MYPCRLDVLGQRLKSAAIDRENAKDRCAPVSFDPGTNRLAWSTKQSRAGRPCHFFPRGSVVGLGSEVAHIASFSASLVLALRKTFSPSSGRRCCKISRNVQPYFAGLSARISGETPAFSCRTLVNPASRSHPLISEKVNVSPSSVFTSMLMANINGSPARRDRRRHKFGDGDRPARLARRTPFSTANDCASRPRCAESGPAWPSHGRCRNRPREDRLATIAEAIGDAMLLRDAPVTGITPAQSTAVTLTSGDFSPCRFPTRPNRRPYRAR